MDDRTFAVTLVKPGPGIPVIEVGAYRYTAGSLPRVGDTIPISSAGGGAELRAYVTRIRPAADAPISVVELENEPSASDDILADEPGHGQWVAA